MGNCSFKSVAIINDAKESHSIRIMTDSGDILLFQGPKFTGKVLGNFPGYGIFRQGRISSPLPDNEELLSGQIYFLLPLLGEGKLGKSTQNTEHSRNLKECSKETETKPVRMSTSVEVLPPPQKGVWKVKFVIDTKQLGEILSEDVDTEALIEQMRLAANTGTGTDTPRRIRINWGKWRENWKPMHSNVLKKFVKQQKKILSPAPDNKNFVEKETLMVNEVIVAT